MLLLKKPADKWGNPVRWLGLGGKVEPGEGLEAAATREAEEESGLTVRSVTLRGTLTYTVRERLHENQAGTLYIFVSDEYDGDLLERPPEGTLRWHQIDEILHRGLVFDLAQTSDHFLLNLCIRIFNPLPEGKTCFFATNFPDQTDSSQTDSWIIFLDERNRHLKGCLFVPLAEEGLRFLDARTSKKKIKIK